MALVDFQNKIIYWDEANWQWLPFVNLKKRVGITTLLRMGKELL